MKRKKRERLAEGEVMYFISSLTYNVVQTHDCYFPTDDQRFDGGNYFPEAKACHACSDEIHETFVPRLEALDRLKKENLDKYVDVAKDVAKKMKARWDPTPPRVTRTSGSNPTSSRWQSTLWKHSTPMKQPTNPS